MSETVYHRGTLTKLQGDPKETAEKILRERFQQNELPTWANSWLEYLCDQYYDDYFYHPKTNTLFEVSDQEYEYDEYVSEANWKSDRQIEYNLIYYNGGCGFSECLEEALDKCSAAELKAAADNYWQEQLWSWLNDKNREPALTAFSAGRVRDIAREIEYQLWKK